MDHMLIKQVFPAFLSAALLMTLFIPGAWAERSAGWWRDAEKQAELEDYRVISTEELHDLYQTKNDLNCPAGNFPAPEMSLLIFRNRRGCPQRKGRSFLRYWERTKTGSW